MSTAISSRIRQASLFCPACRARLVRDATHLVCPRCLLRTTRVDFEGAEETLIRDETYKAEDTPSSDDGKVSEWAADLVGCQLGDYTIEAFLGEGAMAAVFLARHRDLGRRSALKVLSPKRLRSDSSFFQRFRAEARVASSLIHPHVVTTHGVGQASGYHFIEMEFVAGRSLQKHLDHLPMSQDEACRLLVQIADGLAAAHRDGMLHRDLKPDNILLTHARSAKLGDFGLAKPVRASAPGELSYLAGTPHYMAPELLLGRAPGPAADVYSLGVCFFVMLSGRLPYHAVTLDDLRRTLRTNAIPDLRAERDDITLEAAEVLALLTDHSPRNRPADGMAASNLITSLLGHVRDLEDLLRAGTADDPCVRLYRRDGYYEVLVTLPGGRKQRVFVDESHDPLSERLVRFTSTCGPVDSEHFEKVLRMNSRIAHGALAIRNIAGQDQFVMVDSYPRATIDPEEVRRTVWEVAVYADELERELTGRDDN